MASTDTSDREITLTRLIGAPRELVFKVWTQPEHVAKWWGPSGFTNTVHSMDVRPGGTWHHTMHGPNGVDYPNYVRYSEVVPPERLVYELGGQPDVYDFHMTVTFQQQGGQTLLTMTMQFKSAEERRKAIEEVGAIEGGKQTLNKLEAYLAALDEA